MTARELVKSSKFFTESEAWGDLDKIQPTLIRVLISLREFVGEPMVIHNAYELSGHTTNSQHYLGKACDFHFTGISFKEAVSKVEEWLNKEIVTEDNIVKIIDYCGVGIYPFWNNPGFHIDIRGRRASWGYDKSGKMIAFTEAKKMIK